MALLLGIKGKDILQWRATSTLVGVLEEKLNRKWEYSSAEQSSSFLGEFLVALAQERGYEEQLNGELAQLERELAGAAEPAILRALRERYLELAVAHFNRRNSVLALCALCNQAHDHFLNRALALAAERMLKLGQGGIPPYALLVSGSRGRGEQTPQGSNRYFFLYREESARFILFRRQLAALLPEMGLTGAEPSIWHGTLAEFAAFAGDSFTSPSPSAQLSTPVPPFANQPKAVEQELPDWHWRLESLTDLRWLQGEEELAGEALQLVGRTLADQRCQPAFQLLARRVVDLPIALGLFGRWRLTRGGAHQGELDLEELGLDPLVMTLRVLALIAGVQASGTVDRVQRLLEKGALDVDLSERLLRAYQCLMQHRIRCQAQGSAEGAFVNPEELGEAGEARLRTAVEAVLTLQKIAYQRLMGQG